MSDRSRVFLRGVTLAAGAPTEGFTFELAVVRQVESIAFAPVTVFAGVITPTQHLLVTETSRP